MHTWSTDLVDKHLEVFCASEEVMSQAEARSGFRKCFSVAGSTEKRMPILTLVHLSALEKVLEWLESEVNTHLA